MSQMFFNSLKFEPWPNTLYMQVGKLMSKIKVPGVIFSLMLKYNSSYFSNRFKDIIYK